MGNPQSRKWNIVINNPQKYGLTREIIIDRLNSLFPTYYCISDEISKSGTPHTHIFIYRKSPIDFQQFVLLSFLFATVKRHMEAYLKIKSIFLKQANGKEQKKKKQKLKALSMNGAKFQRKSKKRVHLTMKLSKI